MSALWGTLAFGVIVLATGVLHASSGEGSVFRGAMVYAWTAWVWIGGGIIITVLSIRGLLRGEGKPKKVTDNDIQHAKEALDKMYLLEHGTLPPPQDTPDKETESETGGDKKES